MTTSRDGRITLRIPIRVQLHRAHKRVIGPAVAWVGVEPVSLTPFQAALLRGHRWLAPLEAGEAASLKDIAEREGVDPSLVSRLINLTTLAPEVVEAILDDGLPSTVTLLDLGIGPAVAWVEQRAAYMRPGVA